MPGPALGPKIQTKPDTGPACRVALLSEVNQGKQGAVSVVEENCRGRRLESEGNSGSALSRDPGEQEEACRETGTMPVHGRMFQAQQSSKSKGNEEGLGTRHVQGTAKAEVQWEGRWSSGHGAEDWAPLYMQKAAEA